MMRWLWAGTLLMFVTPCMAEEPGTVALSVPMLKEQVVVVAASASAPAAPAKPHANQPVLVVKLEGGEELLPVVADTVLVRDNEKNRGADANLPLRDGRHMQALFKIACESLPADARPVSAVFRFRIGWREKEGAGKITFHRMLTDWSENATFKRSDGDKGTEWNNLRSGVDFEAAPFTVYKTDKIVAGIVTADGFEQALRNWRSGQHPNYGFVAIFSGKAIQINVNSRETPAPGAKGGGSLKLGGPRHARAILRPDLPLFRRLLLEPADLQQATLQLKLKGKPAGEPAKLVVHRMLREPAGEPLQPGIDYVPEPVGEMARGQAGVLVLPGLAATLQKSLAAATPDPGWLLSAAGAEGVEIELSDSSDRAFSPRLLIDLRKHPNFDLFDPPLKPVAGVYARVNSDGRMYYGDRRLRLWGVNRHDAPNLSIVDRLHKTGFNAMRLWPAGQLYDKASAARGEFVKPEADKPHPLDQYDRFVAELKKCGMFVLSPLLHSRSPMHDRTLEGLLAEDSFLADLGGGQADWNAWREAVKSKKLPLESAMYFDARAAAILKHHADNVLEHVNPYTGKRYAEEETIAVWQVQNENGFLYKVLEKGVTGWPPYFQAQFQAKWNAWLKQRYGQEAALVKAWGKLDGGESLESGAIKSAPILAQRNSYPDARSGDFVQFVVELVVGFNRDFREHCRRHAPAGVGVNVVPFIFDTQYRPSIPWLASQALAGDTVALSTYEWGLTSNLTAPPGLYVLDNHTVQGKATIVYETNSASTNPYRAEFPYRIAALASRQDWDAVFFHIFHTPDENKNVNTPDERYLLEALPYLRSEHYWSGTHFAGDAALDAAILLAGQIFLRGAIEPAPAPAVYHMSDTAVYSYRYFNGVNQRADTFSRGSRLRLGGAGDAEVKIERPAAEQTNDPVQYDPAYARMIIDTPTAKAYVGRTAGTYRFRDGMAVGGFTHPFVAFGIVSADGRPLLGGNPAQKALVSSAFNAANTDFAMDMSIARSAGGIVPPLQHAAAIRNYGRAPLLVDRVGWTLWFPTQLSYQQEAYDFALRRVSQTQGDSGNQVRNDGSREIFVGVLNLISRGAAAEVPASETVQSAANASAAKENSLAAAAAASSLWNPLPELNWSDDYATAHQKLRDGAFVRSGISGPLTASRPDASFVISDTELLFKAPANIEVAFEGGRLNRIVATFTQPPALTEAVAAYEKQFGPAAEKHLTSNAFETSTVRWTIKGSGSEQLQIVLTESQGTMSIIYQRKAGA